MPCDHLNVMVKPFSFFPYKVNTGRIMNNPTRRIKTTKHFIRHTQPSSRSDVRSANTALLNKCVYLANWITFSYLLILTYPCARSAFSFLEKMACEQLKVPMRRRLGVQLRETHLAGPRSWVWPQHTVKKKRRNRYQSVGTTSPAFKKLSGSRQAPVLFLVWNNQKSR